MKKYTLAIFACLTFILSACGGSIDNISTGTTEAGLCGFWPTTAGSYTKHLVGSCTAIGSNCTGLPTLYSLLSSPQTLAAITDQASADSVSQQLAQLDYPSGDTCTETGLTDSGCSVKDTATCLDSTGNVKDGMIGNATVLSGTKIRVTYNDGTYIGGIAKCARQCVVDWTTP